MTSFEKQHHNDVHAARCHPLQHTPGTGEQPAATPAPADRRCAINMFLVRLDLGRGFDGRCPPPRSPRLAAESVVAAVLMITTAGADASTAAAGLSIAVNVFGNSVPFPETRSSLRLACARPRLWNHRTTQPSLTWNSLKPNHSTPALNHESKLHPPHPECPDGSRMIKTTSRMLNAFVQRHQQILHPLEEMRGENDAQLLR
jgi:hypothetical protein